MTRGPKFEREALKRGTVHSDVSLEKALIWDCWSEEGEPDDQRPLVVDSRFTNTKLVHSTLMGAVLRNVVIDGVRGDSFSGFWKANEYEGVSLVGRLGTLVISAVHNNAGLAPQYVSRLQNADATAEGWSLDISEAYGNVEIRGYGVDRIRLDPERHAIVRRAAVEGLDLATVDFGGTPYRIQIQMMLDRGWEGTVLCPNYDKRPDGDLQVIRRLKDTGIAS